MAAGVSWLDKTHFGRFELPTSVQVNEQGGFVHAGQLIGESSTGRGVLDHKFTFY